MGIGKAVDSAVKGTAETAGKAVETIGHAANLDPIETVTSAVDTTVSAAATVLDPLFFLLD